MHKLRLKSLRQIRKLKNRPVLLRANFDVPVVWKQSSKSLRRPRITDDYKITTVLPTLRYLRRYQAKIIILSHWGRPQRQDPAYSLQPIARRLSRLLGKKVIFCPTTVGTEAQQAAVNLPAGGILLLENVRFYPGELSNSPYFAQRLAALAPKGIYVNDAFSVSHRRQASVAAIKKFLPAYAGLLLEKEVKNLTKLKKPTRPAVALMGGAKISTKLKVIQRLIKNFDYILVGGAMANNILAARGLPVGKSLISLGEIHLAQRLTQKKIYLPQDVVVSHRQGEQEQIRIRKVEAVKKQDIIFDIGPATILTYAQIIKQAKTIVWNGPMGKFEDKPWRHGTIALARVIASRAQNYAFAVVGGGDTVSALRLAKTAEYIDWVSTGGGAMLAFLGGELMPGLKGIVFN